MLISSSSKLQMRNWNLHWSAMNILSRSERVFFPRLLN